MVATRSVVALAVAGAAALIAAACATSGGEPGSRGGTRPATSPGTSAPAGSLPSGTSRGAPPSGPAAPPTRNAPTSHSAPPPQATHSPAATGPFSLVVAMRSGTISTKVASIRVASNEPVDPPHQTAEQWNTAVWVEQSTHPATPDKGTSYVYGHACHHHVCPFTNLKDARVGDRVRVTTTAGTSTYTINRVGLSPKTAPSLPSWAADSTVPDRLVLVTCAFERGDTSTNNIVVVARLTRP